MSIDKNALKVQVLTSRVAQIVATYEEQLAEVRAGAHIVNEAQIARIKELEAQLSSSDAEDSDGAVSKEEE